MNSLDAINDLIKSCLLPELKQDLDSIPIEREFFKKFNEYLEIHLPLLYECIKQNPNKFLWTAETTEAAKQEFHTYLVVLLCEVSSTSSIFKLRRTELILNAEKILQNFKNMSKSVEDLLFKYYEDKLHKDKWKKQLGAIHGFVKFLEYRFSTVCDLENKMSQKFLMFCLSVALNIRSCYDTLYKALSTSIFYIIMQQAVNDDIISMNIHSVIYDAVFKDLYILDSLNFIVLQWNCLIRCLDFYENINSFKWNYLDDMIEVLLRNISLSPDSTTSICLSKYVSKLIVYFAINRKELEEFIDKDLTLVVNINETRSIANTNSSYTCYRWAKSILKMLVIESYKLMESTEIAKQILQQAHKIYILAILPISLSIVEPHLIEFLEKYMLVLMEVLKTHKYKEDIMAITTSLMETFLFHLQSAKESTKLHSFKISIYALLHTEFFEKYAHQ